MRGTVWSGCVAAVIAAALAGASPGVAAPGHILGIYQDLAERHETPAPLVPLDVPKQFGSLDRSIFPTPTRGGRGYAFGLVNGSHSAALGLAGGEFKTLKALVRDQEGLHPRPLHRIEVRGRHGYLFPNQRGARTIAWIERGTLYYMVTGTPRRVSQRDMLTYAAGLDRLGNSYLGATDDPQSSTEAFGVTTAHTLSLRVGIEMACTFNGAPSSPRVANALVELMPRSGATFSFDFAANKLDREAWTGTVSGTIAPAAISIQAQVGGDVPSTGEQCSSGTVSFSIKRQ